MPSTYSSLKIQLMATGENNTTWGDITNQNLGTAIEEAIVGSATVTFSNASQTLTLTNSNASQTARNLRLNLTGSATSGYNLVVPAIEKPYIVNNGTDGTITVKNSTGTGVAVPSGKTMWVYNDGTNVLNVVSHISSLTLGSALPVASGGTGATTAADARTALSVPGTATANTFTDTQVISVTSASTALRITQVGAGNALLVEDSANPDSTPFAVDAFGNLITGTTSALTGVNYLGNNTIFGIQQHGITGPTSGISSTNWSTSTTGSNLSLAKARGGVVGTHTVVADGDTLGSVSFAGSDGTNFINAASITAQVDGTPGTNDMPGRIIFSTTPDGSATPVERMRIIDSGEVGIGRTPSAGTNLDVGGGTGTTTSIRAINTGTAAGDNVALLLRNSSTGAVNTTATVSFGDTNDASVGFIQYTHLNDRMTFRTNGATAFYVDSTGTLLVTAAAGALGYGVGSGGAVTQTTSRTTGVTLNNANGAITLVSAAGTTTWQSFTVTNNLVDATDVIRVCQKSGTDLYQIHVTNVAANSFRVTFATTGGTTTEQPVFNFAVIKAVTT